MHGKNAMEMERFFSASVFGRFELRPPLPNDVLGPLSEVVVAQVNHGLATPPAGAIPISHDPHD